MSDLLESPACGARKLAAQRCADAGSGSRVRESEQ